MKKTKNADDCKKRVTLVDLINWTYRDQKAHRMSHHALHPNDISNPDNEYPRKSIDSCVRAMKDHRLGAFIPSTCGQQRLVLHTDADNVHEKLCAISRHDPLGALLVLQYGRSGTVPDYGQDMPQPQPVYGRDRNGRERIVQSTIRAGDGHVEQRRVIDAATGQPRLIWVEVSYPYCPITYWPSAASVAASRREYRMWFNALTQLAGLLPPLQIWQVRGMGAQAAPWGGDNDNLPAHQDRP